MVGEIKGGTQKNVQLTMTGAEARLVQRALQELKADRPRDTDVTRSMVQVMRAQLFDILSVAP